MVWLKMIKDNEVEKIERDIFIGNYARACKRLKGLLNNNPQELFLRKKLGDVYFLMGHKTKAGRYWYLEQVKSDEMLRACEAFELSCQNNPVRILYALKLTDPDILRESYAYERFQKLQNESLKRFGYSLKFYQDGRIEHVYTRAAKIQNRIGVMLFYLIVCIAISLLGIGLITVVLYLGFIYLGLIIALIFILMLFARK